MAAAHWTSYYTDEGPSSLSEDGRTLMISVVLDAGAEKDYDGIRVIIVNREEDMFVNDKMDLFRPSHAIGSNYRKSLTSYYSLQKPPTSHEAHVAKTEKLCTVIFELVSLTTYLGQFASLLPVGYSTEVSSQRSARVILDHIEHRVSSTLFFVYCNYSMQPNFSPGGTVMKPTRLRAHYIRVIPVAKSRPPWPTWNLPQTLLSYIMTIAFSEKPKGWRKGLLACSLVCKSWAYLVELFFNDFHGIAASCADHNPPSISSVARSLEMNLSRGVLIKSYSPNQYLRPVRRFTDVAFLAYCQAQNTILRKATAVGHVSLELTHACVFRDLFDILRGLRHVQSLQVSHLQRYTPLASLRHFTFREILEIISWWPRLRKLTITSWEESSKWHPPLSAGPQPYSITDIDLGVGRLDLPDLLNLTGPLCAPPTLRIAHFTSIGGLTNGDFTIFLRHVAPTLVDLSIIACSFHRYHEDEEHALDATIPFLTSLENLVIDGDLSTVKVLSCKIKDNPPQPGRHSGFQPFGGDNGIITDRKHCISFKNSRKMELESVLEALSVTGWDSICIHLNSANEYYPQDSARVSQAARARGIDFRVSIAAQSLRWGY
ncbi:hypothetical protein H0H92_004540 [Tricholoma furcatifolium]|nr:hypothetical protein H0H92_004540 [Tricholoma furcatifolium]